ncbi:hypothetical protein C1O62_02200 [Akkermansia muciniphila]|nr:hypothetical protein C1O62_02200 [Akkermansia muciniphila]
MTGLRCRETGAGLFEIMVGRAKKCLWGIWLCSGLALCVWNAESAGGGTGMAASEDACFIKTFRAKIVPERLRSFVMPADGIVSNWIPADGRVQKDTIIATVNEDEIELERKELEVKILKDRIAKEEELSKLEKQLEEIEFYSSLTRVERQYASKQAEGGERAIRALKDKIELSKKELSLVEDKPRLDFRKKEEKYILRMPFDGKLQYQFSIPPDNSVALYMDAASPIATVCDDSSYYLTISISDPDLTNLPPESLSLSVPLGDGSALKGSLPSSGWRRMFPAAGNCWRIFSVCPVRSMRAPIRCWVPTARPVFITCRREKCFISTR